MREKKNNKCQALSGNSLQKDLAVLRTLGATAAPRRYGLLNGAKPWRRLLRGDQLQDRPPRFALLPMRWSYFPILLGSVTCHWHLNNLTPPIPSLTGTRQAVRAVKAAALARAPAASLPRALGHPTRKAAVSCAWTFSSRGQDPSPATGRGMKHLGAPLADEERRH